MQSQKHEEAYRQTKKMNTHSNDFASTLWFRGFDLKIYTCDLVVCLKLFSLELLKNHYYKGAIYVDQKI